MLIPLTDVTRSFLDFDRAFSELEAFSREMDRALGLQHARRGLAPYAFTRAADGALRDEGDHFVLSAVLPGVAPADIDLQVTADTVSLRAERTLALPEGYTALHVEREGWTFSRAWTLPTRVDPTAVTAEARDGLLTVKLPKAADVQPKRITIS